MPEVQPEREIENPVESEVTETVATAADQDETLASSDQEAEGGDPAGDAPADDGASTGRVRIERAARDENPGDDDDDDGGDDGRRRRPWAQARVEATIEALLFASPDVLGFRQIRGILPEDTVSNEAIRAALKGLEERYQAKGSGIVLAEISGGWQIQTREEHFDFVSLLAKVRIDEKITPATLETLAIIAYKQPITRAEVDAIRGVGSGQIVRNLMDKNLVKVVGRVDLPGRPFQYGTTKHFLDHFGLKGLKDLPRGKDL
ncbi:MAG: SMC-Scp complex subunit ScpB [Planctomycetes bacterium]|nr:SMC-Scp complex subunit ScpB [Planctomycetota bacterium]